MGGVGWKELCLTAFQLLKSPFQFSNDCLYFGKIKHDKNHNKYRMACPKVLWVANQT